MKQEFADKYKKYRPVKLTDRTWPDKEIEKAPRWCSVDLRDGNQALIVPMGIDEKTRLFKLLVETGFKEIEVGFPSAADVEYRFLRKLIEENLIPDNVAVQVLTQAREHLIYKTVEAITGAPKAIVHLYNSTSELQRRVVFNKERDAIKQLAIEGTKLVRELTKDAPTDIQFEYSPESFSGTEPEYAVEVCEAVFESWSPEDNEKIIINLPATVEMTTPNIYADQIEYFHRNFKYRDQIILSIHTHNDRGTAVAAAEMALMAGGERIEGTLFGNGERTGNVDIVTLAMNMYTQGINPQLDFHDINHVIETAQECTRLPVHPRHPYAGELVFTAFSGSHQDAIKKGMQAYNNGDKTHWEVPYLPLDPEDLGRTYESIIRINSQSGKGGVGYILQQEFKCELPRLMLPEAGAAVQRIAEETGKELSVNEIWKIFEHEFIDVDKPYKLMKFHSAQKEDSENVEVKFTYEINGSKREITGSGRGPIEATRNALVTDGVAEFRLLSYNEHSLEEGADARAISYIQVKGANDKTAFGAGIDKSIQLASIKALFSALNRVS